MKTTLSYGAALELVNAIERNKFNMIPSDGVWINIACCLKQFGESGRSLFHRVSCFQKKYDPQKVNNLYSAVLGSSIQSPSLLYMVDLAEKIYTSESIKKIREEILKEEFNQSFQSINYN
ncbi:MAG: hypothetical protein COA97_05025 [Flavobacteriales bacterium]|nr:MAG: hypothetical protein COA97_05025 [Flavobacteriales bacterium]